VTEVVSLDGEQRRWALRNDSIVPVERLYRGIEITCDKELDPRTITRPTCFVTLEVPYQIPTGQTPTTEPNPEFTLVLYAYQLLVLQAEVSAASRSIRWQPSRMTSIILRNLSRFNTLEDPGILAHLTLKGNFIWASDNPNLYLDGEAFGVRRMTDNRTDIRLPSGDGRHGGDFQMWFWLTQDPRLLSVSLPPLFLGGMSITGSLTLTGTAPARGMTVNLGVDNADIVQLPSTVVVPAGAASTSFQVGTEPVPGRVIVNASLTGDAPVQTAATSVTLHSFVFAAPKVVPRGQSTQGVVTLTGPAPSGGASVALSASASIDQVGNVNASLLLDSLPASVLVPEGESSALFTMKLKEFPSGVGDDENQWLITVTASLQGLTRMDTVTKPDDHPR
jgi:hypothetical protein